MNSSVFYRQRYMIIWLSVLLGFLFMLSSSQLIILGEAFTNWDSSWFFTFNLLQLLSISGLTGLLVSPFFFPSIIYGMPRLPVSTAHQDNLPDMVFMSKELVKKRIPSYESEYLDQVGEKLNSCMIEQQPFLRLECNLTSVSKCLDIPVHHLAYYFREVRKQTFNDYRNELRINYAKQLIREGKARALTLEGIALQSGFATRNTFFNAFKKMEGETPGNYSSRYPV